MVGQRSHGRGKPAGGDPLHAVTLSGRLPCFATARLVNLPLLSEFFNVRACVFLFTIIGREVSSAVAAFH